jgi:hypothetical protein
MDTLDRTLNVAQLEGYGSELTLAIRKLASHSGSGAALLSPSSQNLLESATHNEEIQRVQASILAHVAKIKALVSGPTDFLAHLASQVSFLSNLRVLQTSPRLQIPSYSLIR